MGGSRESGASDPRWWAVAGRLLAGPSYSTYYGEPLLAYCCSVSPGTAGAEEHLSTRVWEVVQ